MCCLGYDYIIYIIILFWMKIIFWIIFKKGLAVARCLLKIIKICFHSYWTVQLKSETSVLIVMDIHLILSFAP